MPFVLAAYPLFILSHMLVFAIACLAREPSLRNRGIALLWACDLFRRGSLYGRLPLPLHARQFLRGLSGIGHSLGDGLRLGHRFLCARSTKIFFTMLTLSFSMVVYSLVIDGAVFQLMGGVGWALYLLGEGSMYIPRLTILGAEFPADEFIAVFYRIIVLAFLVVDPHAVEDWRLSVRASPQGDPRQ